MIKTLPNILTLSRILIIPVVLVLTYSGKNHLSLIAAFLFLVACATDFLDGYIARMWEQTSSFGRFLDPIADKLLVASTLLVLVGLDRIQGVSLIPALIILCREILVSGLREFLAAIKVRVPVSMLAKWKTALQMLSLTCLLAGHLHIGEGYSLQKIGILSLWTAAFLTLITGFDYLKSGLKYMSQD